jgi:hypothetical protein
MFNNPETQRILDVILCLQAERNAAFLDALKDVNTIRITFER